MRLATALLALLGLAVITACGGGDDDAEPTATDTRAPAADDEAAEVTATSTGTEPAWFGDHLAEGDCWDDTLDDQGNFDYSGVPPVVDCDTPHDNEVFLVITLEDSSFPGDDAIDEESSPRCDTAFTEFVGVPDSDTALTWFSRWPEPEEWDEGGRSVVCSVYLEVSLPTDGTPIAGSVRGRGADVLPAVLPRDVPVPTGATFADLNTSEDGSYVAMFDLPGSRGEASAATRQAFEGSPEWQIRSSAEGSTVTTFNVVGAGLETTVTVVEFSDGVQWWLYFPGPNQD